MSADYNLIACISKIAQLQGEAVDRLAVTDAINGIDLSQPNHSLTAVLAS